MHYHEGFPILDSEFDQIPDTDRSPELPREEFPDSMRAHVMHHITTVMDDGDLDFSSDEF